MTAVLLSNLAATLFMTGLTWFVQVVHYPLFPVVSVEAFPDYHQRHSNRTTFVVLPPMLIELVSSFWILTDPPGDANGLAIVGTALALATWVLTAVGAAPAHGRIGREGLSPELQTRLLRISWVRTMTWTAHAGVAIALVAVAMGN